MLDLTNNEIIKKKRLSADQKVKLYKDWESLMNQNLVKVEQTPHPTAAVIDEKHALIMK
jgi:hypothetical protein